MKTIRILAATGMLLCMGAVATNAAMAECHDRVVYTEKPSDDHHHVVGTAIGAIAGGLIGNRFGGGSGKVLTTAGGAVAGGAIGHHIAKDESRKTYRTVQHVCTPDNPSAQ
jgi:uncharacterized protein YcfJ